MNMVVVLVAKLVSSSPNQSPSGAAGIPTCKLWGVLGWPNWLAVVQIKAPLARPGFRPTILVNWLVLVQIKASLWRPGLESTNLVVESVSSCPNQSPSGVAGIRICKLGGGLGGPITQ